MNRKDTLKSILEDLTRRRRSFDALRLLLEDDDAETALAMSVRLKEDMDGIVARLDSVVSGKPSAATEPPPPPPIENAAAAPAPEPAPGVRPVAAPAPIAGERGYLGDEQEAAGFERWVNRLVDGCWNLVAHPQIAVRYIYERRNLTLSALALLLAVYTGWNAYQKAYLADQGLVGEYYLDENLNSLFTKRTDPEINFRWLRRAPMKDFRSEHFSIRWTGYVKADEGGTYEFYTVSDDGVRLWIDDQKLIDDWNIHGSTVDKGELTLKPGYHRVRLEYYQGEGDSVLKLQWKTPSGSAKDNIPARFLFPRLPEG